VIELEKHPEMMKRLEPFLVNDLELMTIKYFDGTSRRLSNVKKMGVNNHAFYDYMKVASGGSEAIATLLSHPKVFSRDITSFDGVRYGHHELTRDMRLPFIGNEVGAKEFADQLLAEFKEQGTNGPAHARRRLMEAIGEVGTSTDYERRVEAIVGGLQDFGGEPKSLTSDKPHFDFAEDALRLAMKHPIGESQKTLRRASGAFRTMNNVSLLGFTVLSSLGDVALPIIRSGSFSSWTKAMTKFAGDKEYRQMIVNVGVAMENIVHERMVGMYGATDGKLSTAFFNMTGLTPWTDVQRQLAGATGLEAFRTMQRRASKSYRPGVEIGQQSTDYKTSARFLKRYGLGDFLPDGPRANESLETQKLLQDDAGLGMAIIQFSDEAIFQPNPNDIPMWAQTPIGAMIFQFKSFPLMMGRLSGYVVEEFMAGNPKPALYLATFGVGSGAIAYASKDIIQGRGGDERREHTISQPNVLDAIGYDAETHGDVGNYMNWYFAGLLQMGGMGLLGDAMFGIIDQADNGAYGKTRITSLLFGPSVGLGYSAIEVGAGVADAAFGDGSSNAQARSSTRELATRIPIAGGVRSLREQAVDVVAGRSSTSQRETGIGSSELGESELGESEL